MKILLKFRNNFYYIKVSDTYDKRPCGRVLGHDGNNGKDDEYKEEADPSNP
jgi:hypothetical protein